MTNTSHHIGFISTRFAGTDGVSLETGKWAKINGWVGVKEAKAEIMGGVKRYNSAKKKPML